MLPQPASTIGSWVTVRSTQISPSNFNTAIILAQPKDPIAPVIDALSLSVILH
jgi:hypothetical protein